MVSITQSVTGYLFAILTSDSGIRCQLATMSMERVPNWPTDIKSIRVQNAAAELAERSQPVQYPAVYIYCDRLVNSLKEKFTRFSGKARIVIEVRASQDRIDDLDTYLQFLVDATCAVLDTSRGSWNAGAYYAGGYEVAYSAICSGGMNYIQAAKISCDVEISI